MIINCPQCDTSFFMPDELYKPGRKARCSQCAFIFRLPRMEDLQTGAEKDTEQDVYSIPVPESAVHTETAKPKKGILHKILVVLVILVCMGIVGFAGVFIVRNFIGNTDPVTAGKPAETDAQLRERMEAQARIQGIVLEDVRQFILENDHMKQIVVLQGTAVNTGKAAKEFIRVEGRLLDAEKKVLSSVVQLCGTSLTPFQLKVLTYKEMQEALNNKIAILTNNVDLVQGSRVPFMIVFSSQPPDLKSFNVRVVDAVLAKTAETGQPPAAQ